MYIMFGAVVGGLVLLAEGGEQNVGQVSIPTSYHVLPRIQQCLHCGIYYRHIRHTELMVALCMGWCS